MRSQGSQEWQLAYDSSIPSVHGVDWHTPVLVFFRLATHSPLRSIRRHSPQVSGTLVAFLYTALASKPDGTWRELEPTSMRLRDSQERGVVSDRGISVAHGIDWQSPVRVFSRWATHSPRLPQRTIAFLHSALTTASDGTRRELEPTSNIAVENAVPAAHGVDWQSPVRVFSSKVSTSRRLSETIW